MTYDGKPEQTLREDAVHLTNEARTCELGDAGLTQRRSLTVPYRTTGFVYFIRAGSMIKIGFSTRPLDRLRSLQTSHPGNLEIIGTLRGTLDLERRLHQAFRRYRVRGEWFKEAPAILRYVEGNTVEGVAARKQRLEAMEPLGPAPIYEPVNQEAISSLIAIRVARGADTPIGHRCSTAAEQFRNYPSATPLARRNLQRLMMQSHDDLSRLSRQRG